MSLYSTYWYRVADIRPSMQSHTRISRHIYRGRTWYVLQDSSSSRLHRFNSAAYHIIGLMDGEHTVEEIWKATNDSLGDDAPTQDEVIQLLGRLHGADVLQSDMPLDIAELFERQKKHRGRWKQKISNPFAIRIPLIDPDRFLARWMFLVRPFFGWAGLLVWLVIVGTASVVVASHWPELTENVADRVLQPQNLLLLWLVFPFVKLLHELAHAFCTRLWGGEVHEMGIMFLAFTPIPYVEASSSAIFADKRRRMVVAGAGMAIELLVAALALFVWLSVESGRVSAVAYNVMLIGGFSTLLFNGNPLLRFDGYYILADLIEIPNLAQRSTRYLGYLIKRYLFSVHNAPSPVTAPGEETWFVIYGIAAFFYRIFILSVLVFFISSKFFVVGVLIALWAICTQVILPLVRNCTHLYASIDSRRRRRRFWGASLSLTAVAAVVLFVLPAPLRTTVHGVVTLPEYSRVRAGTECFISEILQPDGAQVDTGEPLIRCLDPYLEAEVQVLEANLDESRARYNAEALQSRVQREILRDEIASAQAKLSRSRERMNELTIRSPNQGIFILPGADALPGHFVSKGELLGYIIATADSTVVVAVRQADIGLIRERTRSVELRLAGNLSAPLDAAIERFVPAASDRLPSPVLGTAGGGTIPVNPDDPNKLQTLQKTFQIEIKLPLDAKEVRFGERVYALFDHGFEPIAMQWYRSIRQLFLRQFHV